MLAHCTILAKHEIGAADGGSSRNNFARESSLFENRASSGAGMRKTAVECAKVAL
jgi:hypothetical protein